MDFMHLKCTKRWSLPLDSVSRKVLPWKALGENRPLPISGEQLLPGKSTVDSSLYSLDLFYSRWMIASFPHAKLAGCFQDSDYSKRSVSRSRDVVEVDLVIILAIGLESAFGCRCHVPLAAVAK